MVYMVLTFINNDMIYLLPYLLQTFFVEVFQMFQELFIWADFLAYCRLHYSHYIFKIIMTTALPQHRTQNFCIHPEPFHHLSEHISANETKYFSIQI